MRILHVNFSDIEGGAGQAAYRLHQGLLKSGVDSQMLVLMKSGDDPTVHAPEGKYLKAMARLLNGLESIPLMFYKNRRRAPYSPSWLTFRWMVRTINELKPDVVHFHYVTRGMVGVRSLKKITAPIAWSLHDMWPFTGGCHYDGQCGKFTNGCGACPVLGSDKKSDMSSRNWKRKRRAYAKLKGLTLIGLSKWMAGEAEQSGVISDKQVVNLPNAIDTAVYDVLDQQTSRVTLGLPTDKKLVVFGAVSATVDERKGYKELIDALNQMDPDPEVEVVVFGSGAPEEKPPIPFNIHYMGRLGDTISLKLVYNAADVMVVPSRQENFSNSILEAMSCGKPVAAFDIGGNGDLIKHRETGYLATPFDSKDLAKGIEWLLENGVTKDLTTANRDRVVSNFETSVVVPQYMDLYRRIMNA